MQKYLAPGPIFMEGDMLGSIYGTCSDGKLTVTEVKNYVRLSDERVKADCYQDFKTATCGALIMRNDWKFPKDYPYQF